MTLHDRKIVVGIDGSSSAQHALRWAIEEAQLRHARIEAVYAWSISAIAYVSPGTAMMLRTTDLNEVGNEMLRNSIDAVDTFSVNISCSVIEETPTRALLQRSADAELLVLGAYASDQFSAVSLGSTHEHCIKHCECPVVIVRKAAPTKFCLR